MEPRFIVKKRGADWYLYDTQKKRRHSGFNYSSQLHAQSVADRYNEAEEKREEDENGA